MGMAPQLDGVAEGRAQQPDQDAVRGHARRQHGVEALPPLGDGERGALAGRAEQRHGGAARVEQRRAVRRQPRAVAGAVAIERRERRRDDPVELRQGFLPARCCRRARHRRGIAPRRQHRPVSLVAPSRQVHHRARRSGQRDRNTCH